MKLKFFQSKKSARRAVLFLLLSGFTLFGFFMGLNQEKLRELTGIKTGGQTVTARQLTGMLKNKNFTFINVHTPYEGEIAKTDVFAAYDAIVANSASLPRDKNAAIILYCKSGRMSEEALSAFQKLGYTNVKHLAGGMEEWKKQGGQLLDLSQIGKEVLPETGVELPVTWGDLGSQLVSLGVIDLPKFKDTVKPTPELEQLLTQSSPQKMLLTAQNSQFVLDVLWALGLAQKSLAYTEGPMGKEYNDKAGNFASTGGWPLSVGKATDHLNQHELLKLTPEQQQQVAQISQNVFRPCCGNSTFFPDCNHGMAMLALIELLVAQGTDEAAIYRYALAVNSIWFPQHYLTLATYFARQGTPWKEVDPKLALSATYSGGQGAADIAKKAGPLPNQPKGGGGCGA